MKQVTDNQTICGVATPVLRRSLLTLCFYCVYSNENLANHLAKTIVVEDVDDLVTGLITLGYFEFVSKHRGWRLSEAGYNFTVLGKNVSRAA
jgi:hypothetical protein